MTRRVPLGTVTLAQTLQVVVQDANLIERLLRVRISQLVRVELHVVKLDKVGDEDAVELIGRLVDDAHAPVRVVVGVGAVTPLVSCPRRGSHPFIMVESETGHSGDSIGGVGVGTVTGRSLWTLLAPFHLAWHGSVSCGVIIRH